MKVLVVSESFIIRDSLSNFFHEEFNVDDIKSISNAQFSNEMDKSYETFDILQKVADNPNLHFALVWYGTQEELDNSDLSEFPGNVTLYVTED